MSLGEAPLEIMIRYMLALHILAERHMSALAPLASDTRGNSFHAQVCFSSSRPL